MRRITSLRKYIFKRPNSQRKTTFFWIFFALWQKNTLWNHWLVFFCLLLNVDHCSAAEPKGFGAWDHDMDEGKMLFQNFLHYPGLETAKHPHTIILLPPCLTVARFHLLFLFNTWCANFTIYTHIQGDNDDAHEG